MREDIISEEEKFKGTLDTLFSLAILNKITPLKLAKMYKDKDKLRTFALKFTESVRKIDGKK